MVEIFRIPEWDSSTGLTHYATTWQIASNPDFADNNIVMQTVEDTENITSWKVVLYIPIGKIYYVRAKRHLKDSDGNVVEYDNWIGVKKIINQDSSRLEPIYPNYYIEQPYVTNITFDADSTKIEITPYVGNVPYRSTNWIIEDSYGNEIFSSTNDNINVSSIDIPYTTLDLRDYDAFYVKVSYNGEFGVSSPIYRDSFSYVSGLYRLQGTKNLNPNVENIVTIVPTTAENINIEQAVLRTMSGETISDLTFDGYKITIPQGYLDNGESYILELSFLVTDSEGNDRTVIKRHILSTQDLMETNTAEQDNVVYSYVLSIQKENFTKIFDAKRQYTEMNVVGDIPIIRNNALAIVTYSDISKEYHVVVDGIAIPNGDAWNNKFIFTDKTTFFRFYQNEDLNVITVSKYSYNPITKTVTELSSNDLTNISDSLLIPSNNVFMFNNGIYLARRNGNDVELYKLDENTLTATLQTTITDITTNDLIELSIAKIDEDKILLLPFDNNNIYSYIYDLNNDTLTQSLAIPSDFRNITLAQQTLLNGDVVFNYSNHSNAPADKRSWLLIFRKDLVTFEVKENSYSLPTIFRPVISLGQRYIDYVCWDADTIYRFR